MLINLEEGLVLKLHLICKGLCHLQLHLIYFKYLNNIIGIKGNAKIMDKFCLKLLYQFSKTTN